MNGFDDFATQVTAEEYYTDEHTLCRQCGEQEAVEDGFCSFDCENTFFREMDAQTPVQESGDEMYDSRYDDFLSQYDDDPNPYAGTYSEE